MMQPLPAMSLAYKLLLKEEKQRQSSLIDEENKNKLIAFAVDYKKPGGYGGSNRNVTL